MASTSEDVAVVGLGCLAILTICAFVSAAGMAVVYFGWNLAIVPIFGLPEIGFWTAFWLSMLLGFIGGCFKSSTTVSK